MRSNKNGLVKDYHLHNNTKTRPWASIGFTSPRFLVGFVLLDVDVVCPFVLFPLVIVLSVLHRIRGRRGHDRVVEDVMVSPVE